MGVDSEAVSVSVTGDGEVGKPTSTDGRDAELSPSLQSVASLMPPPDGRSEVPRAKKRRVMFADE